MIIYANLWLYKQNSKPSTVCSGPQISLTKTKVPVLFFTPSSTLLHKTQHKTSLEEGNRTYFKNWGFHLLYKPQGGKPANVFSRSFQESLPPELLLPPYASHTGFYRDRNSCYYIYEKGG